MPEVTFYRHGLTAHKPNRMGNPNPPKRGRAVGWGPGPAKRNVKFLRSVDETALSGEGWAITLTVRDLPETPAAWTAAVKAWIQRQERKWMIRLHWVMEFQRRGVPHLHAAAWYEPRGSAGGSAGRREDARTNDAPLGLPPGHAATADWVDIAGKFGAGLKGQHARPIEGAVGWFQYMAKHCSRSAKHYQRQRDAMPSAWESSPRVWGHRGDWTLQAPATGEVTPDEFYRLRRLIQQSRLAEARAGLPLNRRQVAYLRRIRKCPDRKRSEVRPVSEWVNEQQQQRLLEAARHGTRQRTRRLP